MMRGVIGQQNSCKTLIGVHEMHLKLCGAWCDIGVRASTIYACSYNMFNVTNLKHLCLFVCLFSRCCHSVL